MTKPVRRIKDALSGLKYSVESLGASVNPRPLIILGNQKSGTTAIAALLAQMSDLSVTLDLPKERGNPVIDKVKTGDMSMTRFVEINKLDFARDIIKEPSLSPFYEELVEVFPQSRFVMVIRDPRDNLRSILNRLRIPGNLETLSPQHDKGLSRAWRLILDGRWLGLAGENYIDMLALRWSYITNLYLRNSDKILLCQYEVFLQDKAREITRLANQLGLPARKDITSKVDHQFQPAGDRSVSWADFFGANLDRIERACGEGMARMNYELAT